MYFPYVFEVFNPLSANVVYARYDSDVTCSGCSASYSQIHQKQPKCFL